MKKLFTIVLAVLLFYPSFAVAATWYDTLPEDRQFVPVSEEQVKEPLDFEDLNTQSVSESDQDKVESPDPEQEVPTISSNEQPPREEGGISQNEPGVPLKFIFIWIILGIAAICIVIWLIVRFRSRISKAGTSN